MDYIIYVYKQLVLSQVPSRVVYLVSKVALAVCAGLAIGGIFGYAGASNFPTSNTS
ncbi:MAG: hypothetical protein GY938_13805 [Ketobacter sp.]|nr:hypothetical protein [Ketobacter sp.]